MPSLRLHLLGSPRIERDDESIEISRRKTIALLSYLAVTGESHRREALAALLWPDSDQSRALAYLRRTLWSLKQALGNAWLDADHDSIALVSNQQLWLDVEQFQQLLSQTQPHHHPQNKHCDDCLSVLTEAVALYRGDFLTGFTLPDCLEFDEWQFCQAESLRQQLALALEWVVDGLSRRGEFETAIPHARRWLSLDNLHEPAQQALMKLYAWAGQQAAALRQYEECVRILDEELGTPPLEETTVLYEAIKAKRLSSPTEPVVQRDSPSTGSRTGAGESVQHPLLPPSLSGPQHNLPVQPTPFIGRREELAEIERLVQGEADCRLLTIVGPGGMGKSRLSIQAAAESRDVFADGVTFVPLALVSSAEFLISAITDALNITVYGARDPKTQLLNYLRAKSMLLVLDNFEHLLEGANLLSEIVLAALQVKLLVTSRERLNLQEEWVFELQGMTFPSLPQAGEEAYTSGQEGVEIYSALQLFDQRARQVQADFDLAIEYPAVVHICQLVNGMPLGLELAATWLKLMSCREVADEIEQNLDFLATTMRNVPERHRSLRAVFRHSWQLLSDEEKDIFKKLSVFRGGFSREATEQVAGASLPLLSALVDKSLLRRTEAGRYEIHELLRQYATEKLQETPKANETAQTAHAYYYANFLHQREADLRGARQQEALEEIAAELDNVRASWAWTVERADIELIGKSLESLYQFSEMRGRAKEGEAALRQAVARLADVGLGQSESTSNEQKIIVGKLMGRQGFLSTRIGLWEQGMALIRQGALLLRQAQQGAEPHLAAILNHLALGIYFSGQPDKAKQFVQEALALATAVGDKVEMAYAYNVMGHLAEFQGEYMKAGPLFEKSIRQYQEIGEQWGCAYAQNNWGRAAYAMGEYDRAEELIQVALTVRRQFNDLIGLGYSLLDMGQLAKMRGEYAAAENYIREALSIVEEVGVRDTMARCYHGLGIVAEGRGDFKQAEAFHRQSLTIYREISVKRARPLTLNHLSRTAYKRGDYQLAQQRLQECLAACDEMENRGQRASALRHQGHVAVATGNSLEARRYFRHALEILVETGARPVALDVLVGWATMLIKGEPTVADQTRAIELVSLVQHHPASEHETREKAKRLLVEWADYLPSEMMVSAQARGQARDLESTVRELIFSSPKIWDRPEERRD